MKNFAPSASPLARAHHDACRIGQTCHQPGPVKLRRLLFGRRSLRIPVMSVINDRELGRCRHALAQRVVAGTLEVQIPWAEGNPFVRKPASEERAAPTTPHP